MKLGLILPGFSHSEDDWCIPVLLDLVRALARSHEVHVFPLRYPFERSRYQVFGASVHPAGGGKKGGPARLRILRRAVASVLKEHRERPFTVLHGIWADEPGVTALAAGRLTRVPVIVSLMGGELSALRDIDYGGQLSRINRWMVGRALRGADQVTAGSTYLQHQARRFAPGVETRRLVFGVDDDLFRPGSRESSPLGESGLQLLHVASLVPVKNQSLLLRAFARVVEAKPETHLHLVGEGPLRPALLREAQEMNLSKKLHFHGAVNRSVLPLYYRAADLCVLSSRHEGQELVSLEAAACARATVGTAVGLLPDLAPDCVVSARDPVALAKGILDILDSGRHVELGRQARETIVRDFSMSKTVLDLAALYRASISSPVP